MSVQKARTRSIVLTLASNQSVVGYTDTAWFQVPQGIGKICVQVVATSTAGHVSASYQPMVSNDGVHWVNFDSPIELRNIPNEGSVIDTLIDQNFSYLKFELVSITGTNAKVTLTIAL